MIKKIVLASILSCVLIVGASQPVQALTSDELQAQVQRLLSEIAALTAQLSALRNQTVTSPTSQTISPAINHRICLIAARSLSQGAQGDDVRALQEFLADEQAFSGAPTGYFGSVTAGALQRWQVREGIEPAGIVGPKTMERIKVKCGVTNTERFAVSQARGNAPLTATFYTWISGFRAPGISYVIDFGDSMSEYAANCSAPADACTGPGQNPHTYSQNGTYTATLTKITNPCVGMETVCKAAVRNEVVAKTQVVVGAGVGCTKEYVPVCGAKPIYCITTPCNPVPTTYGNRCEMSVDNAALLYEGQCRDSGGNKPPTISGFSGPTTLSVNQTGTWTINASDPENGQLSYIISYGDEYNSAANASAIGVSRVAVQTSTFTHSYTSAGTYTVSIIVRDNVGQEAKTSMTVRVGGDVVVCTQEYAPVCGRPYSYCPSGTSCQEPVIRTYGNRCTMNAAGATYLYEGQCNVDSF